MSKYDKGYTRGIVAWYHLREGCGVINGIDGNEYTFSSRQSNAHTIGTLEADSNMGRGLAVSFLPTAERAASDVELVEPGKVAS